MKTKLQFRVLYRQFLFRLMDVDLLSGSARGDANELLGQFAALLVFGSVLLSLGAVTVGQGIHRQGLASSAWSAELFLISVSMLVVGVFALLSWETTFLDRRDLNVLSPLPVRVRTLFAAKVAATATALGLTVAAWNSIAGFLWPMILAPDGSGVAGTARFVVAFWITVLASGTFLYCVILVIQAAAAQLPRKWYLRVSSVLQIVLFGLLLGVVCFQPSLTRDLGAPENQRTLAWLPSYWFLGLLSELSGTFAVEGHTLMLPLARRATIGLAVAILAAAAAFLVSYLRTLRKVVEEPDVTPGLGGGLWLPFFGTAPQTALAQFVIRSAWRSRRHRAILASYLGGGFAITAVYLEGGRTWLRLGWNEYLQQVPTALIVPSVLMLAALWLGVRTSFSIPLDLRANWLFRVTPVLVSAVRLRAIRRALLTLSLAPVLAISAVLLPWFRDWAWSAGHLVVLALLGCVLGDISLKGFRKIPFTCSYLPGKSKVHLVFWFGIIPLVIAIHKAAEWEQRAMSDPVSFGALAVVLGFMALAVRRFVDADRGEDEPQFEEMGADEVIGLGLDR